MKISMIKFSSLAALAVVKITTFGAASGKNFIKQLFLFQYMVHHCTPMLWWRTSYNTIILMTYHKNVVTPLLTRKQLKTHGCIPSNVAIYALVLKHQTINIHRTDYRQISNISHTKLQNIMFLVSPCSCLFTIYCSQVLSWEWRCSWSSADRRCSNYIWVINNLIAYEGAAYIRDLTVDIHYIRQVLYKHSYL